MAIFILFAIGSWLKPFDLLIDGTSKVVTGAGYIDVTVKMGVARFMTWIWLLMAFLAIVLPQTFSFIP
jgi:uncharacterized membrane protein (UPF0182 family)